MYHSPLRLTDALSRRTTIAMMEVVEVVAVVVVVAEAVEAMMVAMDVVAAMI